MPEGTGYLQISFVKFFIPEVYKILRETFHVLHNSAFMNLKYCPHEHF